MSDNILEAMMQLFPGIDVSRFFTVARNNPMVEEVSVG